MGVFINDNSMYLFFDKFSGEAKTVSEKSFLKQK